MPKIISVDCIWNKSEHNGFTDLIEYKSTLFCAFREANSHAGDNSNGFIRILKSSDGDVWEPAALLKNEQFDLRDPKFSIMPNGQLMLNCGGSIFEEDTYIGCHSHVAFSEDGIHWSSLKKSYIPNEWIWHAEWYQQEAFAISYKLSDPSDTDQPWFVSLVKTSNGIDYEKVIDFDLPDFPSEATVRFLPDGTMIALLRRFGPGWIGIAAPPYKEWQWNELEYRLGGPDFIILPDGQFWAASRLYVEDNGNKETFTAIGKMTPNSYLPELVLPSGGDTSYPGMVFKDNILYVSYYSSHEGKSSIYIAKIQLP